MRLFGHLVSAKETQKCEIVWTPGESEGNTCEIVWTPGQSEGNKEV